MLAVDNQSGSQLRRSDGNAAVKHIVRILVVPDRPTRGSPKSTRGELTAADLKHAQGFIESTPAPFVRPPKGKRAPKLVDVLESTDIIVIDGKPASLTALGAVRRLKAHDHHDKRTVLRVWTESDTIEYQCDEEFAIVRVEQAAWRLFGAPDHPFATPPPYVAVGAPGTGFTWTSSTLTRAANNQQYKMSFRIRRRLVDPDIVCGDPPPI
jgi:hypothetical protein